MRIKVADKNVGEIIINSNKQLGKTAEYAAKSLCMLQLLCMNANNEDKKLNEFVEILNDTLRRLNKLYKIGATDVDPFEQFYTS